MAAFTVSEVIKLGAGHYDVRLVLTSDTREQQVQWRENVVIEAGRQRRLVTAFDRGFLRVEAYNADQPIATGDAIVYVYRAGDALREVVDSGPVGKPLALPVGIYDIEVVYEAADDRPARDIKSVTVTDQQTISVSARFRTGTVLVRARIAKAEPLQAYEAYVYFYSPDDHRVAIAYSPAGRPMRLTEGLYDIRTHLLRSADKPNIWHYDTTVQAGKQVEHEVVFDSGHLLVRALNSAGDEMKGDETSIAIFARGERVRPNIETLAGVNVTLATGAVDLRVRGHGGSAAVAQESPRPSRGHEDPQLRSEHPRPRGGPAARRG